jgi:hypothetical protein
MSFHDPRAISDEYRYAVLASDGHVVAVGNWEYVTEVREAMNNAGQMNGTSFTFWDCGFYGRPEGGWKNFCLTSLQGR